MSEYAPPVSWHLGKNAYNKLGVVVAGLLVGILGGLIGLGGAEFRLPLLIGAFGFAALSAVVLNKATSLVVVASSLPFRADTVPFANLLERWNVIVILLAGSLAGAWYGAGLATRMKSESLYRVLALLLLGVAALLLFGHGPPAEKQLMLRGVPLIVTGIVCGFGIGVVASLMGVAGGELLIPTIVLVFGADIKLAGSLSLAVSLPTMIVAFARYSQDRSFEVIRANRVFLGLMAAGSIAGVFIGSRLLGIVSDTVLLPFLAAILVISAKKVWLHGK